MTGNEDKRGIYCQTKDVLEGDDEGGKEFSTGNTGKKCQKNVVNLIVLVFTVFDGGNFMSTSECLII